MRNPDPSFGAATPPASRIAEADRRVVRFAALMLAIAVATILAALGFEHIGGYQPCPLCLMQRTPYYLGIPLVAAALVAARLQAPRLVLAALFGAFALAMLYNAGLAAYHAGVEWRFWEGPAACAPSVEVGGVDDLLDQLENATPPSCTDAAWRLLGLSFAGWNAIVSALLAGLGLYAARLAWRRG